MNQLYKAMKIRKYEERGIFLLPGTARLNSAFGIFDLYGVKNLQELKRRTRKKFREIAFQIHPDTGKKRTMRKKNSRGGGKYLYQVKLLHDKIQNMKYVPMTLGNMDKLLELQKGYKSIDDIDLGLNG